MYVVDRGSLAASVIASIQATTGGAKFPPYTIRLDCKDHALQDVKLSFPMQTPYVYIYMLPLAGAPYFKF